MQPPSLLNYLVESIVPLNGWQVSRRRLMQPAGFGVSRAFPQEQSAAPPSLSCQGIAVPLNSAGLNVATKPLNMKILSLRALTILQPHADAIMRGKKLVD